MKILNIKEKNCLTFNAGFEIEYEDKNGLKKSWELISRGNLETVRRQIEDGERISASVSIVATDETGERLCVIKQFRITAGKFIYEFPSGLMDEGENVEEAAIREFKEETGMELKIEKILPPRYTSIGLSDERCSVVYGTYRGLPSQDFLESEEEIIVELADRKRLREILEKEDVALKAALAIELFLASQVLTPLMKDDSLSLGNLT